MATGRQEIPRKKLKSNQEVLVRCRHTCTLHAHTHTTAFKQEQRSNVVTPTEDRGDGGRRKEDGENGERINGGKETVGRVEMHRGGWRRRRERMRGEWEEEVTK